MKTIHKQFQTMAGCQQGTTIIAGHLWWFYDTMLYSVRPGPKIVARWCKNYCQFLFTNCQ